MTRKKSMLNTSLISIGVLIVVCTGAIIAVAYAFYIPELKDKLSEADSYEEKDQIESDIAYTEFVCGFTAFIFLIVPVLGS